MLAAAYENGQIAGRLTVFALLIAGGVALVHRLRGRHSPAVDVVGIVLMAVAALAVLTGHGGVTPERAASKTSNAAYVDQARRDMIAGCTDQGSERAYCECFAEQMLERNGHDAARLRKTEAELNHMREGSPPPAMLVQASQACADPA